MQRYVRSWLLSGSGRRGKSLKHDRVPRKGHSVERRTILASVQPAGHIIEARMRAMLANVPGEFQEGHELDDKTAKKVPKAMIGRVLSRKEATAILGKLG
jgi:hypothetical protein